MATNPEEGMSTPHRHAARLVIAAILALSACGDESGDPTSAEADKQLQSQVRTALEDSEIKKTTIIDAGGRDRPCGKGRARRTFAIAGDREGDPALTPVEIKNRLLGGLPDLDDFHVTRDNRATYAGEPSRVTVRNDRTRTTLKMAVPSKERIEIHGETDCLAR